MFIVKIAIILFILIVALCCWKTAELFNIYPDKAKGKVILAWDIFVLFLVLVALVAVLCFI